MVFDYTADEKKQLADTHRLYTSQLDALEKKLGKCPQESAEYKALFAQYAELEDQRLTAYSALYTQFEKARFDALNGDAGAILEDGKQQTELIIEFAYVSKAECDIVLDDAGNWKPRKEKPLLEYRDALALLKKGLWLHIEALAPDKERTAELNDYMFNYLGISDYVYIDKNRKTPPQEIEIDRQYAQLTQMPQLSKYGLMRDRLNKTYLSTLPECLEIDGQQRLGWALNQSGKETVPIVFALSQGGTNIKTTQRLDATDDAIISVISSCILAAQGHGITPPYNITPQEVWRRLNGITDNSVTPSAKQLKDITARLDKMRLTLLYMDVTKELEVNSRLPDDDRLQEGKIEDYYLPARKFYAKTEKGRKALAYSIYDLPFVYAYNRAKGHVVMVDAALLNTSDETGNEGYTLIFRNYLLMEIARMYQGLSRDSKRILYDTLYRWTGTPTPEERANRSKHVTDNAYQATVNRERKKDREKITAILQSWTNRRWILGYEPVKRGKAYIGVDIKLNPKNMQKSLQDKKG